VLELELDEVPNFMKHPDGEWMEAMADFLAPLGLQPTLLLEQTREVWLPAGYHLIGGPGPRGVDHSVVGYQGVMVHDPHPDGTGLLEEQDWTVFVATLHPDGPEVA
jgi:hypothetical protein